jgi:glutathione synthase/RimK-type ligase-like ATP-grasp enzyme
VHVIIADRRSPIRSPSADCIVITPREFLRFPELAQSRRVRVINLSRDQSYLGYGYYCSLLAEARQLKAIPSVRTMLELRARGAQGPELEELEETLIQCLRRSQPPVTGPVSLLVYFGRAEDARFVELGRRAFDRFQAPILRLTLSPDGGGTVTSVRGVPVADLDAAQLERFQAALAHWLHGSWRAPRVRSPARYRLAILHNPAETLPPSKPRALQRFIRVGETLGLDVELIEKKDFASLAEYDALFIRETTGVDHHTWRFARKAESEGMPVIDDATSILRCANKVYLAELLRSHRIPTPKTVVFDRHTLDGVAAELGFPLVLKIPDGSFSRGMTKCQDLAGLRAAAEVLLRSSDVVLAQEFMYTEFDWRIGVLRGQPLFACQYFMSEGHWQVVKHDTNGTYTEGNFRTIPVEEAPPEVVALAIRSAALVGDGLHGVDVKQSGGGSYVMEINDNPNLDHGIEDAVLKDELYRRILLEFVRRLEERGGGRVPSAPPRLSEAPVRPLGPARLVVEGGAAPPHRLQAVPKALLDRGE